MALIVAGASSNLLDRMRLGYVVDFLQFGLGRSLSAIYNVADVCILTGIAMILAMSAKSWLADSARS